MLLREQSHTLYPVCKSQSGGYLAVGTWRESLGFFFGRGDSDDRIRGKHRSLFEAPLRNVMEDEHHLHIVKIMRAPMEGLIAFHAK